MLDCRSLKSDICLSSDHHKNALSSNTYHMIEVLAWSLQWGWCTGSWNEIWSNDEVEENQCRQIISAILVESVVIQQSRVANTVIIVMLNEENLTKKPNGSSTGLGETSRMIQLHDHSRCSRVHPPPVHVHFCICPRPIHIPSYINSKIFPASRQEKPVEITQRHKGTMKDENIRGRCPYLAHQWLKFQPNEGEEDLRSVQ